MTETARNGLARTISTSLANSNGELAVLTLEPRLEQQFADRLGLRGGMATQAIEPDFGRMILEKIEAAAQAAVLSQPVVLCSAMVRPHLRKLTERFLPELAVMAHGEAAPNISAGLDGNRQLKIFRGVEKRSIVSRLHIVNL